MTKEEIKETYSMRDILERYGLEINRAGFCHCPFHQGDRDASLKVYEKDFNCFGCGVNGDIFTFIQRMENVSFREAFLILGGTYEKPSFSSRLAVYRSQKKREYKQRTAEKEQKKRILNNMLITVYRRYLKQSEPLSEVWCSTYNALQYQLYMHEILNEKR